MSTNENTQKTPADFTLRTIDLRGSNHSYAELRRIVPRQTTEFVGKALTTVHEILENVQDRGADYLRELSARFDGVEQGTLCVPQIAIDRAVENLDPGVRKGLEIAIERTRAFAAAQRPADQTI